MHKVPNDQTPRPADLDNDQQDSAQVAALAASQVHPASALPSRPDYHIAIEGRDSQAAPSAPELLQAIPVGYVLMPKRLTAENGAKGALSGEFKESVSVTCHECGGSGDDAESDNDAECPVCKGDGTIDQDVPVTWDTIKDIYRKAVELLAAPSAAAPAAPDWVKYDATSDVLEIHRIKYSSGLFNDFASAMPEGQTFKITSRANGVLRVEKVAAPAAPDQASESDGTAAACAPVGFMLVPKKITPEMIEAAMIAHYGKRRVTAVGGAAGIDMTVNDTNFSGATAMRNFWRGALAAAPVIATSGSELAPARTLAPGSDLKLEAALDREYPLQNSPHPSVNDRACNNRTAFERGWYAARKAVDDPYQNRNGNYK